MGHILQKSVRIFKLLSFEIELFKELVNISPTKIGCNFAGLSIIMSSFPFNPEGKARYGCI